MVELEVVLLLVENDEIVFSETVVTEVMVDELLTLMTLLMVVNEVKEVVVYSVTDEMQVIQETLTLIIIKHSLEKIEEIAYTELVEPEECLELVGTEQEQLDKVDTEEMVEYEELLRTLNVVVVTLNDEEVETPGEDNMLYLFQLVDDIILVQTLADELEVKVELLQIVAVELEVIEVTDEYEVKL